MPGKFDPVAVCLRPAIIVTCPECDTPCVLAFGDACLTFDCDQEVACDECGETFEICYPG